MFLLPTLLGCRAGEIAPIDNNSLVSELIAKRDAGLLVFSAARSWQNTYEWEGLNNSIFATAISNSFEKETDTNQDGVISLSELHEFTTTEVERISRQIFKKETKQSILDSSFKPRFESNFQELIKIPHTPWLPNLELFGDIPLIPLKSD